MLYNLALTLGLTIGDTDSLTAGELIDLTYYRANQNMERENRKADDRRAATQDDYDSF